MVSLINEKPYPLQSILCDRSEGKKVLFKRSIDLQNFRICFRKFRTILPLPFGFRCNHFRPRCCELMLSFSMYSDCKADKCLLTLCIVKFAFLSSCRMICFENTILQLGGYFKIFDFSMSKLSAIFLDVLVVASLVPTWRIK